VASFFGFKVCVFLENDKTDLRQFFFLFQDLGRKHLVMTTYIEKQCTRPLKSMLSFLLYQRKTPQRYKFKISAQTAVTTYETIGSRSP